jgi:leucyl/phenylalanyl-tRNA--protein transferase
MIPWLELADSFPPLERALRQPAGLLAAGADLSPTRLLLAYRQGIFPWYSEGQPILWWSPDPRMVLPLAEFHISRSLAKTLRARRFEIRADTRFREVMLGCAAPRRGHAGTWIMPEMVEAYCRMHELGYAHSVEAWAEGKLVGGLYGMGIGRMFFGESMFARVADASKVALVHLVRELVRRGYPLIDCQQETAHLARFGARAMPRARFAHEIAPLVNWPEPAGLWTESFAP